MATSTRRAPLCTTCGQTPTRSATGRCRPCYFAQRRSRPRTAPAPAAACSSCGARRQKHSKRGLCRSCDHQRRSATVPATWVGQCAECGQTKRLPARGRCERCYQQLLKAEQHGEIRCERCGAGAIVRNGRCASCARRSAQPRRRERQQRRRQVFRCADCGGARARQSKSGRCRACFATHLLADRYPQGLNACRGCEIPKPLYHRGFCATCYGEIRAAEKRGDRSCEACGTGRVVHDGKCAACRRPRRAGGTCAQCTAPTKTLFRDDRCWSCHAQRRRHPCTTCGALTAHWRERCVSCVLQPKIADRLRKQVGVLEELFAGHAALSQLLQHWKSLGDDAPYAWAHENTDLLRAAARGDVDHEDLNRLPFGRKPIETLRLHLENAGLLEPMVLNVDLFTRRVAELTADVAAADALLLKEYARLHIVPLAQRRLEHGERVDVLFRAPLSKIGYLVRCAEQLRADPGSRSLATIEQPELDCLTAAATYTGKQILRSFARWLNRRRAKATKLATPRLQKPTPKIRLGLSDLVDHVARAVAGSGLSVLERLTVLLTALYGQQFPAIAALHVSQLNADYTAIRFNDVWLEIPDPMPALFRDALAARADHTSPWVFPSRQYRGKPMSPKSISNLCARIGFPGAAGRGAALVTMLRTIEFPLLGRMFGLSLHAASRWASLVDSPSWDRYVALRHAQDNLQPTTVTIADRVFAEYRGDAIAGELGPTSPAPAAAPLPEGDFETLFSIRRIKVA